MFTIYSKENCPACVNAKNYLTKLNKEFTVIMVNEFAMESNEITKEEFQSKFPGVRSVPYIVDSDNKIYKSYNELVNQVK